MRKAGKGYTAIANKLNEEGHRTLTGKLFRPQTVKNYVLRYDWRYRRPRGLEDDAKFTGNSGCLVHIQDPEKGFKPKSIWPECVEVQGMNRFEAAAAGLVLFAVAA